MTDPLQPFRELAKRDAAVARGRARRRAIEVQVAERRERLSKVEASLVGAERSLREHEIDAGRQSNALRDERSALEERRQNLATLMAAKLQEAALREISTAELSLDEREGQLLTLLEQVERLKQGVEEHRSERDRLRAQCGADESDAAAEFETISQHEHRFLTERAEIAAKCPAALLQQYERARTKYPTDPIAVIDNHHCSGCRMQIGAQIELQVLKLAEGEIKALVRCPGCSRLLFLPEDGTVK